MYSKKYVLKWRSCVS